MSEEFALIRPKIRLTNILGIRRKFIGLIGQGYTIRVSILDETFYTVPTSPNEILVSIDALRAGLSFLLDPFILSYLNAFKLTPI